MKIFAPISLCILVFSTAHVFSQSKEGSALPTVSQQQAKSNAVHNATQRDGQVVFEQNCSRCHNAPQGFSPRISGTVVRHMRVRAGLSAEDEKALLRFFNP
jgi:cytochrome c5